MTTNRRIIAALSVLFSVTTCLAQQADPALALQSARERLLEELKSLPRYTCVQTINRQYFRTSRKKQSSCSALISDHAAPTRELPLEAWHRVLLHGADLES